MGAVFLSEEWIAELAARGAARNGINWQFCRPPIDVLDYEMDVRRVPSEFFVNPI